MTKKCVECDEHEVRGRSEFCSDTCRAAFHNRRMRWGAMLFDLLMYERSHPERHASYKLGERFDELVTAMHASRKRRLHKTLPDIQTDSGMMLRAIQNGRTTFRRN